MICCKRPKRFVWQIIAVSYLTTSWVSLCKIIPWVVFSDVVRGPMEPTLGNQNAQLLSERPIHEYGTSNQGIKHGIATIRSHFSDHRKWYEFNHMWPHSTHMFVRFIPRQWVVDLIWWILRNSLHRRAMSKDYRSATGIIASSKSQMVRFVLTSIDCDGLNMYLTI